MASRTPQQSTTGYHEGELLVQQRAGVRVKARRLVRLLDHADLTGGVAGFLDERTLAVLTARDRVGTLWISPLTGPTGFLEVTSPTRLGIAAAPAVGDPLSRLPSGQSVGLVTIDLATRRRLRINGHVVFAGPSGLIVDVEQAYGNCPQFIQQRQLSVPATLQEPLAPTDPRPVSDHLEPADIAQIGEADTFFLGTTHPDRGNDASHRGGPPGFVRVEDERSLWWPDYPGNNMFNSLGNIAVDPVAALLFVDFTTGRTLHLTGRATLDIAAPGRKGDDGGTGRRIRFHVDAGTGGHVQGLRAWSLNPYPLNPPIRD
jgi:predicted pyridoxine 5'-phosphate oxidase superfamily flavin-nucleotide-binding protein